MLAAAQAPSFVHYLPIATSVLSLAFIIALARPAERETAAVRYVTLAFALRGEEREEEEEGTI